MAETLTARVGLRVYSAGTDTFGRTEYDDNMQAIENLMAIDQQGTLGSRPAAGLTGRYWYDTSTAVIYRDNGTSWTVVGSRILDEIAFASATNTVPLTASGLTSQTGNLFEAKITTTTKAFISAAGQMSADNFTGKKYAASGGVATDVLFSGTAASSQSADVVSIKDNSNSNLFKVSSAGTLTTSSAKLGTAAAGSVVGTSANDNVAGQSTFTGSMGFEVYSAKGGSGSTFTDGLYLKHQAADSTAVLRRFGVLMKVGDEISGDATKSAGMYLESSAALFASPTFVLFNGDEPVMQFPMGAPATVEQDFTVNGQATLNPSSSSSLVMGASSELGAQGSGTNLYARVGASGKFSLYAGGAHSGIAGDAGSGGATIASFAMSGGVGQITVSKALFATSAQVGPSNSGNTVYSGNQLQSLNNGSNAAFSINPSGGIVTIGSSSAGAVVPGSLTLQGHKVSVQSSSSAPSSPAVGDVWIQI